MNTRNQDEAPEQPFLNPPKLAVGPMDSETDPQKAFPALGQLSPVKQYYHDLKLDVPSTTSTLFQNAEIGFAKPFVGVAGLLGALNPDEAHQWQVMKDVVDSANSSPLESPWQSGAGTVADFIGSVLNPLSLKTADLGGYVVGKGLGALSSLLPRSVGELAATPVAKVLGESATAKRLTPMVEEEEGVKRSATLGEVAQRKAAAFGVGAGVSLPLELEQHYDTSKNRVNLGEVVKGTAAGGGVAVGLDVIPYMWGVLRGKFKTATGGKILDDIPATHLDDTLKDLEEKGVFTKEESDWYREYRENGGADGEHSPEFVARGSKILLNQGHAVDSAAGKVVHDILTPGDVKNLNIGISDQLAADLEKDGTAVTDYILGSKLDGMRDNPKSLDGINGIIDFLEQKLKAQPGVTAALDNFITKNGTRNWRRLRPISQEKIYKEMVSKNLNADEMPHHVPEGVVNRIKIEKQVKKLEADNKNHAANKEKTSNLPLKKKYQRRIDQNQKKIDALNAKKPELLEPKEELSYIHGKLVKDGKLIDGYKNNSNYLRLRSLARVETGARSLLYKIHTLAEYQKQAAYKDVLQLISNVMQSNFNKLADPKKVIDYLKNRLEDRLPQEVKDKLILEDVVRTVKDVPADYEKVLDDTREVLRQKSPEGLTAEFEESAAKVKEFGKSANIFENLIKCVMGSLNG